MVALTRFVVGHCDNVEEAIKYVKAGAQAEYLKNIMEFFQLILILKNIKIY